MTALMWSLLAGVAALAVVLLLTVSRVVARAEARLIARAAEVLAARDARPPTSDA